LSLHLARIACFSKGVNTPDPFLLTKKLGQTISPFRFFS